MVTVEYPRTMSRYNRWQNRSLVQAASTLTNSERWLDRGAFFGSIAATLNHILWDDQVWLARLSGDSERADAIGQRHPYTDAPEDWSDYVRERERLDESIAKWAQGLTQSDLEGRIEWMRGEEPMSATHGFYVVHLFNHQAHHRGQVHAMLAAAGATPEPTDLPVMP